MDKGKSKRGRFTFSFRRLFGKRKVQKEVQTDTKNRIDPLPKSPHEPQGGTACQQKPATPFYPETGDTEHNDAPRSLWDEAYDSLKGEKPKLIARYEELLSQVVREGQEGSDSDAENAIPQNDAKIRRQRLSQVAELGFKRMEEGKFKTTIFGKEIVVQDAVGAVGQGIQWVQHYAKSALEDVPYAPIAMAGVSLLLPFLTGPSTACDENQKGLLYVTSQIRYYIEMEPLLQPENMATGLKSELANNMRDLYKLVINFQVKSVMRFYRGSTENYLKDFSNHDDWSGKLERLKEKEKTVGKNLEKSLSASSLQRLGELRQEAEKSSKSLSEIADQVRQVEQHMLNAENRHYLDSLSATNPEDDKSRIENFKGGLLEESYRWILENEDYKRWKDSSGGELLWIKGDPGKGKTMLMCGIINELSYISKRNNNNIAFFFCQVNYASINNAASVLRGLIYMLVKQQPALIEHLSEGPFEGQNAWFALKRVFTNIANDPRSRATYVLIDALDECADDLSLLLSFLVESATTYSHIKWVVSSRNWPSIERELKHAAQIKLRLELNEDVLCTAVSLFIQKKVVELTERNDYSDVVSDSVKNHLNANAKGTFLWVALVCKALVDVPSWDVKDELDNFPAGLDEIYRRMMTQIGNSKLAKICMSILRVAATVYRPITLDEIVTYLDIPEEAVRKLEEIVQFCGSFLVLQGRTILLLHKSAKDFLLGPASDNLFPNGLEAVHHSLFSKSLVAIERGLRQNIYDLPNPGVPITQIKAPSPDPLLSLPYACIYWIDHLSTCTAGNIDADLREDKGVVGLFFRQKYLQWLEAMSILKCIPVAIAQLRKLKNFILTSKNVEVQVLYSRVEDAIRFVQYSQTAIDSSPLQVYYSALFFSPANSITRTCYEAVSNERGWFIKGVNLEKDWSVCLQTLEGHSKEVYTVAWSPNGTRLASAGYDNTVRVWDAETGQCVWILRGHSNYVSSVAWSPDGKRLTSESTDSTVRMWDPHSGKCIWVIPASDDIRHVTWSPDGTRLASVSDSATLKIWNADITQHIQITQAHDECVQSLVWSPDGSKLASSSSDRIIKIWDAAASQCLQCFQGYNTASYRTIQTLSWSPDGKKLAATSGKAISIWDPENGERVAELKTQSNEEVMTIAWSHDGRQLAYSQGKNASIWDFHRNDCVNLRGHTKWIHEVAWSPKGDRLASGSSDCTIRLWNTSTRLFTKLQGHAECINFVVSSGDESQLASIGDECDIQIWSPVSGRNLKLEGHTSYPRLVAWSPDGNQLVSAGGVDNVRVWDLISNQSTELDFNATVVAWSQSGDRIASGSVDGTVRIRDTSTGETQTLKHHSQWIWAVVWSPNQLMLASGSVDNDVCIWHQSTGHVTRLKGHTSAACSVSWSPDESRIASGSMDGSVRIWTLRNTESKTLNGHTEIARSVVWSHDGTLLASASDDKTVRLWNSTDHSCILVLPLDTSGFFRFDAINSNHLQTMAGTFDLQPYRDSLFVPGVTSLPKPHGYGFSDDHAWIMYDGLNVLRIPPEYRPKFASSTSISGNLVRVGCQSGRAIFLEFSDFLPVRF